MFIEKSFNHSVNYDVNQTPHPHPHHSGQALLHFFPKLKKNLTQAPRKEVSTEYMQQNMTFYPILTPKFRTMSNYCHNWYFCGCWGGHDYKSKSWILEKPGICEKFLRRYGQMKLDLFQKFLFIPDFILNSRILPSQTHTNHPAFLLDILCLAKLN